MDVRALAATVVRGWHGLARGSQLALAVGLLLALVQTTRGVLFTLHPDRPVHTVIPHSPFHAHHSCFTAYHEAGRLVSEVANVYELKLYERTPGSDRPSWQTPRDPRRTMDGFFVDPYEYPPTFLLLPRVLQAMGLDFMAGRALWFVFQTATILLALVVIGLHLGSGWGTRFALLAPFIYLSPAVQMTIQIGNFQVATIALGLLAMIAIERGHHVVGAATLSFVVAAKLFPGVLLLALLARRQWRPLIFCLVGMLVWAGLALAVFGPAPFEAFWRYHLPRIQSAEAFPQMRIPLVIAVNQSIYGLPGKLALWGIGSGSARLASALAWAYTLVPCAVALIAGRRWSGPMFVTLLLALGTYRAPFLPPDYAPIGPVLVLALLVAAEPLTLRTSLAFAAAYLLLHVYVPRGVISNPPLMALLHLVPQVTGLACLAVAVGFLARGSALAPRHALAPAVVA